MRATEESPAARLDALRRRLYRADATDEDRRRYAEELAAAQADVPTEGPAPRRRRRLALPIAAGAVVLGALVAAIRVDLPAPATRPEAARPSSTPFFPGRSSGLVDIGDGDVLPVGPTPPTGPTPVAASIDGLAVAGARFQGSGDAVVAFDPPAGAWSGGRLGIAVTSAQPARVAWRSLLTVTRTDWTSYPLVLASGTAERRSGAAVTRVFEYPGRPPTRVAIEAPEGVGWTLVVAATGARPSILR